VICLLLMFSLKGIFSFVHIKKKQKSCWCLPRTLQSLHRLLTAHVAGSNCCNHDSTTSFDLSWRFLPLRVMYVYGLAWNYFFFYFFSLSFFLELRVDHAKNHALQFIFSFDLVHLFLFAIVLFTLIISNWILFLISSLVIWFDFFSNLGLILLIAIYFILESFSWLICFYSNSTLGFILIHLIYMSNLFLILLISIFFVLHCFFPSIFVWLRIFFF